jgi:diaminopimelate decarboxylase
MLPKIIKNVKGELYIEGVSTTKLADAFDTPLYVMSDTRIRENYRTLESALNRRYEKIRIYYSAKANTNLSIFRILRREGAYIDTVSPGEVHLALKAGFPSDKILFTGTSVRNDELRFLLDSNVTINIDSLSQLKRLLKTATPEVLSVRVNPGVGAGHHEHVTTAGRISKFGVWRDETVMAYKKAKRGGVKRFGLHMHIGSGILDIEPFEAATRNLLHIAKEVHKQTDISFEFINIGGGIGVPYTPEDKELKLGLFSERLLDLFKRKIEEHDLGEPIFSIEPGRYIVCDAGVLLTTVNTVKVTPYKKFIGVDAGFNTLIRPTMYGSYHHILVANKLSDQEEDVYDVAGPICESGDILAKDRRLPKMREGDLLAVLNAGAYGYSMSSQYNSRPRAAEILVKGKEYALIRERESFNDLMTYQKVAPWL